MSSDRSPPGRNTEGGATHPENTGRIIEIPVAHLRIPPGHASRGYSGAEVEAFAQALRATGRIENPILVRAADPTSGDHDIISGLLRLQAARRNGWTTVPCCIRNVNDVEASIVALVEDLAGKREKMLPLGWTLLEAMEVTGWSQARLARTTGQPTSTISEAIRAARAIPQPFLEELAAELGVDLDVARALPRSSLRKIRKIPDREARRTAVAEALEKAVANAPIDDRQDPPPRPITLADGGVRLDLIQVRRLGLGQLLWSAVKTLWILFRTWVRNSRLFAKVRRAKPAS